MDVIDYKMYVEQYLLQCEVQKNLDSKTLKAYKTDLNQFDNFIKEQNYCCDKEVIQLFLEKLHERYKIRSIKRKIASIKAFFSYLEYEDKIEINPFANLKIKLHEPRILPRIIPMITIEHLLKCAYHQKNVVRKDKYQFRAVLRDIAVLELLFGTGVRVSELCELNIDSIDFLEGTIMIYGKGAKERVLQISNPAVMAALVEYYQAFSDQIAKIGSFFLNRLGRPLSDQSVRNMITKYVGMTGSELHITPHMFRHSFATYLLEEDVDIRYIQHLLGHSSISTTQIYTHVTVKKQREILTVKHPRNKMVIS